MLRQNLLTAAFLLITAAGLAQDKKDFKNKFIEAEYFFFRNDYREAAFLYNELLKTDPANANLNFLTGACYLSLQGEKDKAIPYLEKAIASISPGYREGNYKERNAPKEAWFALAKAYHIAGRFADATEYYTKYKNVMRLSEVAEIEFVNKHLNNVELARQMLKDTLEFDFFALDPAINASTANYHAVYAEDDSVLIYMADKPFYAAIMMSRKTAGGWTPPETLNPQLEADDNVYVCDISSDGKELYLMRMDEYDRNLYISNFKSGRWSPMQPLDWNINSEFNEQHASISKDKRKLYFTSDRPDGNGGMDIYISTRFPDGSWGSPVNAGKTINSIYSEATPFISNDGKTLFFSSMGHPNIGGYDIFYSTALPNGQWSAPANMGFPLNTCDDDLFFNPLHNGELALFTSFNSMLPLGEILTINLKQKDPGMLYTFRGSVITDDALSLEANTRVVVSRADSEEKPREFEVAEGGDYAFELPAGKYNLTVDADNYVADTTQITILAGIPQKTIYVQQNLVPDAVDKGEAMVIRNLLFGFDSFEIDREAAYELEKLFKLMSLHPEILVQISGYADAKGDAAYNLELSKKRARSAVDYLVEKGLARERFISKGFGESEKFARNENPDGSDNPDGRRLNRQVEIRLINADNSKARIEEILVPEHLKPIQKQTYFTLLSISDKLISDIPANLMGQEIKLWKTNQSCIYYAGGFKKREDAMVFLNNAIEHGYTDARLLTENEINEVLHTGDKKASEMTGPFTIQMLALRKGIPLKQLKSKEKIQEFFGNDGIHRYTSGIYKSYDDASSGLIRYINEGYTDAFVMELSRYTGNALPDNALYFSIQLSATKNPPAIARENNLPGLRITLEEDGYYHLYSGFYGLKSEAEMQLEIVRKNGFPDAFIRKVPMLD
jgi:outer membrane protein OmpA-like peptidoglycan-associated protein/tetratricopeptide (TPR) repeat protein